jgi:hypothetical protein
MVKCGPQDLSNVVWDSGYSQPDKRDPRTRGGPCSGRHQEPDRYQANQASVWKKCQACALRMCFHPKKGFVGKFRTGGPAPRVVEKALDLGKDQDRSWWTAKRFEGLLKIVEGEEQTHLGPTTKNKIPGGVNRDPDHERSPPGSDDDEMEESEDDGFIHRLNFEANHGKNATGGQGQAQGSGSQSHQGQPKQNLGAVKTEAMGWTPEEYEVVESEEPPPCLGICGQCTEPCHLHQRHGGPCECESHWLENIRKPVPEVKKATQPYGMKESPKEWMHSVTKKLSPKEKEELRKPRAVLPGMKALADEVRLKQEEIRRQEELLMEQGIAQAGQAKARAKPPPRKVQSNPSGGWEVVEDEDAVPEHLQQSPVRLKDYYGEA